MASRHAAIGEVRGIGPMAAIELVKDRDDTGARRRHRGARPSRRRSSAGSDPAKTGIYDNVIRILVPITAPDEDLEAGLDRLEESLGAAAA